MCDIVALLKDFITGLFLESGKNFINEIHEQKALISLLSNYIEKQEDFIKTCSYTEEFDLQGLSEFIQGNFIVEVTDYCFSSDRRYK